MSKAGATLRSLGAVLAGYLVTALLTAATIGVLALLFPASYVGTNVGWVLFNVAYGCVYAVLGGYLTARLAPRRPMPHALALGLIMGALALLTAASTAGDPAYADSPAWYYPALAVTVIPSVWLGGRLRERQLQRLGA